MKRLLLLALAAATAAHAQRPTIDISGARVQAYPIALAPPSGAPEGADVLGVLAADFDRSGLFLVADHSGSDRNNDGIDSVSVINNFFTNSGVSATLAAGKLSSPSLIISRRISLMYSLPLCLYLVFLYWTAGQYM